MRDKDVQRKRQATAAKVVAATEAAAKQAWQEHEQGYWAARLEEEFWAERQRATPYWSMECCGLRIDEEERDMLAGRARRAGAYPRAYPEWVF